MNGPQPERKLKVFMIVTIDGPAGAGKSSVARALADRLGFHFLDTGAMYRAVAWAALRDQVDLSNELAVTDLAQSIRIEFDGNGQVCVDGLNVGHEIRSPDVTEAVKIVAGHIGVREILAAQQRRIGETVSDLVTEGRDQGTVVFPHAQCKIFLTATPEVRAKRRWKDLTARGEKLTLLDVLTSQNHRDQQDSNRSVGPLTRAEDAVEVYTDDMTEEQVLNHLAWVVASSRQ